MVKTQLILDSRASAETSVLPELQNYSGRPYKYNKSMPSSSPTSNSHSIQIIAKTIDHMCWSSTHRGSRRQRLRKCWFVFIWSSQTRTGHWSNMIHPKLVKAAQFVSCTKFTISIDHACIFSHPELNCMCTPLAVAIFSPLRSGFEARVI